MMESAQPFVWFDERAIETEHDQIVNKNLELRDHLAIIHGVFEILHRYLRRHDYSKNTEALVTLRLVARAFNTAGACLKLGRAGYFQPAFAMVRDLLEIEFLTDLFTRDRAYLHKWMNADAKIRRKEFRPVAVRDTLDKLDGSSNKKRAEIYALLSTHATHVDFEGFSIISPDSLTQIGPFPSEKILTALFQELVKHIQSVCIHFTKLLDPEDSEILNAIGILDKRLREWRIKYQFAS